MSSNDSTGKTLLVASLLCIVCSIVVSTAAVALKSDQVRNKLADKNKNILAAAGMMEEGKSVDEIFKQRLEVKLVNLDTGEYLTEANATEEWEKAAAANPIAYDQRKASKTPGKHEVLDGATDIAGIKRQAKYATVYLAKNEQGEVDTIILPVHGYGLWSTLYGFLALKTDTSTIVGLGFYEHGETPGLGGEVDNPNWKALWPGKQAFDNNGEVEIHLIKGSVNPSAPGAEYQIDGLAGATLTSIGVTNLIQFWLGKDGFGPYLAKVKEQGV
ncbi:MAG: Na(+)-translocating NADH-quinone reductase subunit C [Pseudomonadales bacterium]|nr:Na(+)-translocating NADH-quinone reductase subunit C [Pseudomonadales bacterium]